VSLLPVEEALERIFRRIPAVTAESVSLSKASGRVLAEPLIAAHDQPPFSASAMDGYAVRAADVVPGAPLNLIGTSQAGAGFPGYVQQGECVRIFTGAPVPAGADAVIMQEEASARGSSVSFAATPPVGRSIRPAGYDFRLGTELLPAGTRLTPFHLALAAAANRPALTVARRPSIALLATGDELILPGEKLDPDQIVASNSFGLAPLLAPFASAVDDLGIARDNADDLAAKLETAFSGGADILVTTGGASVGDHDIVQQVLRSMGVEIDFWRINMRPGKPLMFGTRGKTLIFGLPGNPVSALVTAVVFLLPALGRWSGDANILRRLRLPLATPTPPNGPRRHFMRARLAPGLDGRTAVHPTAETDSGHTSSLAYAEALLVQPENDPGQEPGTVVEAILL
jgi:molybdopterin molybdotransferase